MVVVVNLGDGAAEEADEADGTMPGEQHHFGGSRL